MIKYDRFWETLKKRHISQYYLINECGIEKRLLRRLRDNENVEIFSLDRICTVLNCDTYPITLISLRMRKQPKKRQPHHILFTLHRNNWCFRLPQYKPYINYTCLSSDKHVFLKKNKNTYIFIFLHGCLILCFG